MVTLCLLLVLSAISCPNPEIGIPYPTGYVRPIDADESVVDQDVFGITIDDEATPNTRKLYTWLQQLSLKSTGRIVSGQHIGCGYADREFDNNLRALFEETGKWPAMMGVDYFRAQEVDGQRMQDSQGKTDTIISYWAEGGLATVTAHLINPWTGGITNDKSYGNGTYADAYTRGTLAYNTLKADFDLMADEFLRLQAEGVTVLFRPFHEMNGPWFWWYTTEPADFIRLWRYWQSYLMNEREVHNLLYVFSPNASGGPTLDPVLYYPGDDYIDILAMDTYRDNLLYAPRTDYTDFIDSGNAIGKPFGFGELGRDFNNISNSETWNQMNMIDAMREVFPEAVFWQSWSSWENANMAIADLPGTHELVDDPLVLTREELSDLEVFRAAAKAYTEYHYPEKPPIYPDAEPLIPTGELQSQQWAYTFTAPAADWTHLDYHHDSWKKGMSPFGSPWVEASPVMPRLAFRFSGIDNPGGIKEIFLRKEFNFSETMPDKLFIRTFMLGAVVRVYLNGILIAEEERNHETMSYLEIPLGKNSLGALRSGKNVVAIHCIGNLTWGDVVLDFGLYATR